MKINHYRGYDEYRDAQIGCHDRKRKNVWASERTIDLVIGHIRRSIEGPRMAVCHGVRTGTENRWLSEKLGIRVIGTDIQDTGIDGVIQHDFHEQRDEWVGKMDFVYSNSLDHSYNPQLAVDRWMASLRKGGICFIDWSDEHGEGHINDADCFGASPDEMRAFLSDFGKVVDIPIDDGRPGHIVFAVTKK